MDTTEHTELGNALRLRHFHANPYIRTDDSGVIHLRLQRFGQNNLPEPMALELSAGEVIAMAGDYFTQADWSKSLNLPNIGDFESAVDLGRQLIDRPILPQETAALISAYNNLAAPDVTRKKIDLIYTINDAQYIPFSNTLNFYAQQIMYGLRVKNYGEMVTRDISHFTPWSVRAYVLGHSIALHYAQLAREVKKLARNPQYQSENAELKAIQSLLGENPEKEKLIDLAYRYEAQSLCIELFTFHYYTDHFATGHMSMTGDLRTLLQTRFGTWGSILANSLHDETNRVGVYTNKPYDPTPNYISPPTRSRGDGVFDTCLNHENRRDCLTGLTESLNDIVKVLRGGAIPNQSQFAGLEQMPDVDYTVRQHQPLLVLSQDKVFYRDPLQTIAVLSPTEYDALRADPGAHGYKELSSKWGAFLLVAKLRLFPYIYNGQVTPVSSDRLIQIKLDEKQRNPLRHPIPNTRCEPEDEPTVLDWRTKKDWMDTLDGLHHHSVLKLRRKHPKTEPLMDDPDLGLRPA